MPHQLIYSSRATERMPKSKLYKILFDARTSNAKLDVTGVLVYADGLFLHHTRPAAGTQLPPMETDITLPNINCEKCTLQIVQFMEAHGLNKDGDYTYHHCSDLKITAAPAKPIDKEWQGQ